MIAAYNLANKGHDVLVLEKSPKIGGTLPHHPSNHATPVAVDWIWDYIGIDLSGYFHQPKGGAMFVFQDKFSMPGNNLIVERGPRKTAVDSFLYDQCLKAGVKFEFNRDISDPFDMPDPTIIATGLHKDMGHQLSRPMLRLPCFSARRKLESAAWDGHNFAWIDDYTRTYGYAAIINDLEYYLLFSNDDIDLPELKRFEEHLEKSIGVRFDSWDYFEVWVPLESPDAPKLFVGSKILAGTIAGMMCPNAYFGIHGAMISGKIAAIAVTDPEQALTEMKRMSSNYVSAYKAYRLGKRIPKNKIQRLTLKYPFIQLLLPQMKPGIPGMADQLPGPAPKYQGKI